MAKNKTCISCKFVYNAFVFTVDCPYCSGYGFLENEGGQICCARCEGTGKMEGMTACPACGKQQKVLKKCSKKN